MRLTIPAPMLLAAAMLAGLPCASAAQSPPGGPEASDPSAPPPAFPDKRLYAFAGYWKVTEFRPGIRPKGYAPLNAQFEAKRAALEASVARGEPPQGNTPRCIPNGPPSLGNFDLYVRGKRLILVNDSVHRYIDLDARHTSADQLFPTYTGESVARFEGNTLVVDTIGLLASNEIIWGVPNSGALHVVERFRLLPDNLLEVTQEVSDPGALMQTWINKRTFRRQADPQPIDIGYCVYALDQTRDPKTGEQIFDLTPPSGGYVPPDAKN